MIAGHTNLHRTLRSILACVPRPSATCFACECSAGRACGPGGFRCTRGASVLARPLVKVDEGYRGPRHGGGRRRGIAWTRTRVGGGR